jgi:two-component system LytT family response regulator
MIRTLIIEDEEPAARRLEKLLRETEPKIEILETLDSVEASVKWLETHDPPDLIMLDIQLADGQSFEIFRQTPVNSFVIFTTAYDEYAIKAFELNSIDYLLKPVDRSKLEQSLRKFREMTEKAGRMAEHEGRETGHEGPKTEHEGKMARSPAMIDIKSLMETLEGRKETYKKRFAVNIGSRIVSVETSSVAWFYTLEKSTYLCTNDNRHYPLDFSLEHLEEILDPDQFFRINRQYLIRYSSIKRIHILSKSRIKLEVEPAPKEDLLVSTARTHEFRLWLDR